MEPIWGRQDPGGLHVGPMNLAVWDIIQLWFFMFWRFEKYTIQSLSSALPSCYSGYQIMKVSKKYRCFWTHLMQLEVLSLNHSLLPARGRCKWNHPCHATDEKMPLLQKTTGYLSSIKLRNALKCVWTIMGILPNVKCAWILKPDIRIIPKYA